MALLKHCAAVLHTKSAITLFLFFTGTTSIGAQDEISTEQVAQGLALRVMILVIAAIIALIARALLIRRLNKLMLSESKKQVVAVDNTSEVAEVPAPGALQVNEVHVDSEFANQGAHVQALDKQAKRSINRVFIVNFIIGILYAICYFFVFNGEFKIFEIMYDVSNNDMDIETARSLIQPISTYRLFVILFLVWTVMQFLGSRHQFAAYGQGSLGFLKPVLKEKHRENREK